MPYIWLDEANEAFRMDPEAFLGNAPKYLNLDAMNSNSPVVRNGRAKPLPQILVV